MKRFKHRMSGLLMALGLAAVSPSVADEVVATAAGGWFAVDARAVKDTTLAGGLIVGGVTNVVLQSSPDAWGETGGGASATITCESATGSETVAEATTAGEVSWTPKVHSGLNTLTYTSGSVQKTAQFLASVQVGDEAFARIMDGTCTVFGTGDMWSYDEPAKSPLWDEPGDFTRVVVDDATSIGKNAFAYFKNIRDVEIGGSVTNVAADAFYRCTYMTNLVVGAGVKSVGAGAFERCYSLEAIRFGSKAAAEACQEAYKITARITMDGETPVVDAVPEVRIDGCAKTLYGATNLTDAAWLPIADPKAIPYGLHFFKWSYD